MSNYTALYTSADVAEVVVDLLVGTGAALVGFVTIIGLILLYNWIRGTF